MADAAQPSGGQRPVSPIRPITRLLEEAQPAARVSLTDLPNEVLSLILDYLLPTVSPTSSTYPNPALDTLDNAFTLPSSTVSHLYHASLACSTLHGLAQHSLWRAPLLTSLRAIRLLAAAIQDGSTERAGTIRALHLPAADGVLEANDTLADQSAYQTSLRTIFDHADRIDCISLGHRPAGRAFYEFLHPHTAARPRTAILGNLSFSTPPFSQLDLAPLSCVRRLHLVNIVPPPALISFLCGQQVDTDSAASKLDGTANPSRSLTHIRLSLLPPDSLLSFPAFIEWRRASDAYDRLPTRVRLHTPAPRAPQGPARRFAAQEALYTLATHSHLLPNLRALLLELVALHPLSPPEDDEEERFNGFIGAANAQPNAAEGHLNGAGVLATTNYPADVPVALSEDEQRFLDAERERLDEDGNNDNGDGGDSLRTAPRDQYWTQIQAGKRALVHLWNDEQGPRDTATDIRIVAARPGGHDKYEGIHEFLCQSGCFTSVVRDASPETAAAGTATADVGSWADPDVFELARTRPALAYRPREGRRGEGAGDWRGQGSWWTGELPRVRSKRPR
ncbi:uncharacterized protein PFL1_02656 [Pseudozyma flocculosa PF-1]|uniref:F-box domain-containing protein n=2 Tax=Pseudozyma flocculosa TaxID=84751 RepID=A0A5C3F1G2_9BASI|nr:uncharacterized protein PFL1_02656 [Pseudozyma flocculosa PF-1]EPQ29983.1 hypothetical protein PFL1_02656 [Pseudozyma flocculosa PF-1]SPO37299.1 uncharacterized protein PSFLO_02772 [Pseudozyma flocculosa]